MKRKLLSKLLAAFLTVAMVFTLTPMFAVNANAQTDTAYGDGYLLFGTDIFLVTGEDIEVNVDYSKLSKGGTENFGTTTSSKGLLESVIASKNGTKRTEVFSSKDLDWHGTQYSYNGGYYFEDGSIDLPNNDNTITLIIGEYAKNPTTQGNPDWSHVTYNVKLDYNTVTYALNDSTSESRGTVPAKEYKYQDQAMNLTSAVPTKTGTTAEKYNFAGWTTVKNGTTVEYAAGAEYNVNKDITLYPVWDTVKSYDVTFDLNATSDSPYYFSKDGDNYVTTQKSSVENGKSVSEPDSVLSTAATGTFKFDSNLTYTANHIQYVFDGWNTKSDGSGDAWSFNDSKVTKATTLYAQWKKIQSYGVSYDINLTGDKKTQAAAAGFIAPDTEYVVEGKEATAPEKPNTDSYFNYDNEKYYFNGWNTKADGTGDYWSFTTNTVDKDVTLYAQWGTEKYYNILYVSNVEEPYDIYTYGEYFDKDSKEWTRIPQEDFDGQFRADDTLESAVANYPKFYRADYKFKGWSADTEGTETYNVNKTVKANLESDVHVESDNTIKLYAQWSPKYSSASDVKIKTTELAGGTYAEFYSDFITAKSNDASSDRVYRNFVLVDKDGDRIVDEEDTVNDSQELPVAGLYLNKFTGEVYGAPREIDTEDGPYTFNVRMCNDEGKWISEPVTFKISISKADLGVDLSSEKYSKTYGEDDPGDLNTLSENLSLSGPTDWEFGGTKYVKPNFEWSEGDVAIEYDYYTINGMYEDARDNFDPAKLASYQYTPDPYGADNQTYKMVDKITATLVRVSGEDAGMYKRYLETFAGSKNYVYYEDNQNWSTSKDLNLADYYNVDRGPLGNTNDKDSSGNTYADKYFLKINQKEDVRFDSYQEGYIYGQLAPGDEVEGAWNKHIVCDANDNVGDNVGIEDAGKASVASKETLQANGFLSGAGKLKAGSDYTNDTALTFSSNNSIQGTTGLSTTKSAVTTDNYYEPSLSLDKVAPRKVGVYATDPDASGTVTAGTAVAKSDLQKMIKISAVAGNGNSGVIDGDDVNVDLTKATFIIGIGGQDKTYDEAIEWLTEQAKTAGDYSFTIHFQSMREGVATGVLSGADAGNYYVDNDTDVTLHVVKGMLLAKSSPSKKTKMNISWTPVAGASSYAVYGSRCNKSFKKLKSVNAGAKLTFTHKKLKKHKKYKYYVNAYNASGKVIATSKVTHSITAKTAGRYAEVKKITANPASITFTGKGQTRKISSSIKVYKGKKCLTHEARYRYLSSDPSIATVDSSGTVTSVSRGTCTIYVQAVNGMWAGVSVTFQEVL